VWNRIGIAQSHDKELGILKQHLTITVVIAILYSSSILRSQTRAKPVFSIDAQAENIPNLDNLIIELKQYHDCTCKCGCYAHDLDTQAHRALAFLDQRAAHRQAKEKLAVVFDIDETSLSNYQQMLRAGFVFDAGAFNTWVNTAAAPSIPGTLRIDQEAQRLGVDVFFITGRPDSDRAATERNLRAQGYAWKRLTLRPESSRSETTIQYKSGARAQIAAQGYKIILNVGDQWSDLKGAPEAEFSVKYPNPYYLIP
jgi:acid phosphatase